MNVTDPGHTIIQHFSSQVLTATATGLQNGNRASVPRATGPQLRRSSQGTAKAAGETKTGTAEGFTATDSHGYSRDYRLQPRPDEQKRSHAAHLSQFPSPGDSRPALRKKLHGVQQNRRDTVCGENSIITRLGKIRNWESSDREFKITMINTLRVFMEKVNNMQEQMGSVSREMETQRKKNLALAGVTQWIERQPANQRVTGLIPSQGTCLGVRPGPQ